MKKYFGLFLMTALVSCSHNEDISETDSSKTSVKLSSFGLKAITIDNGLSRQDGYNNIIVFPTIEDYSKQIDYLDVRVEDYVESMQINFEGVIDEDEIDLIAERLSFDEDRPLIDFENQLNFYSLRRDVNLREIQWLRNQGDGEWDLSTDPDNHFILEDTERTLLNIGNEFIVGKSPDDYQIYKLYENAVIIFDWNQIQTLKKINLGNLTPSELYRTVGNYKGGIKIKVPDFLVGLDPFIPAEPDYGPCKERNDIRYKFNTYDRRRIKTVSKFHDPIFLIRGSTVKAKTKVYKKSKILGWIPANGSISVSLLSNGRLGSCTVNKNDPYTAHKSGTRHKVKVVWNLYHEYPVAVKNKIISTHTHRSFKKEIDLYDSSVSHL